MSKSQTILDKVEKLNIKVDRLELLIKTLIKSMDNLSKSKKKSINSKSPKLKVTKTKTKKKKIIKLGNVILSRYIDTLLVTGDTYSRRAILTKYKSCWKPDKKGWTLNLSHYKDIKEDLETYCESVEIVEIDNRLVPKESGNNNTDNSNIANNACEIMSDGDY